jgi:hypothetical protein
MYENIRNWQGSGRGKGMRVTQIRIGWRDFLIGVPHVYI